MRRALLFTVLAFVVGGHLASLLTNTKDFWPFSTYHMYTVDPVKHLVIYEVIGVLSDGRDGVWINREFKFTRPQSNGSIQWQLHRWVGEPDAKQKFRAAASDILRRYEVARTTGRHDGPPIVGVRIYSAKWNVETKRKGERFQVVEVKGD